MAGVPDVVVNVVARTEKLRKGLDQAATNVRAFGDRVAAVATKAAAFGAVVGAIGLGALASTVRRSTKEIEGLVRKSDELGITVQRFTELGFAARQAGVRLGAMSIDEAVRDARQLGATVSTLDATKVELMADQFRRLGEVLPGIGRSITVGLAPALDAMATSAADALGGLISGGDGLEDLFDRIGSSAVELAAKVLDTFDVIKAAPLAIEQAISQAFSKLSSGISEIASGPIARVIAGIVGAKTGTTDTLVAGFATLSAVTAGFEANAKAAGDAYTKALSDPLSAGEKLRNTLRKNKDEASDLAQQIEDKKFLDAFPSAPALGGIATSVSEIADGTEAVLESAAKAAGGAAQQFRQVEFGRFPTGGQFSPKEEELPDLAQRQLAALRQLVTLTENPRPVVLQFADF